MIVLLRRVRRESMRVKHLRKNLIPHALSVGVITTTGKLVNWNPIQTETPRMEWHSKTPPTVSFGKAIQREVNMGRYIPSSD
jgi:hypothetical protein